MRIDYGYRDCANIININYKDRDDFDKNKGRHILTAYKDVGNFVTYNVDPFIELSALNNKLKNSLLFSSNSLKSLL